jgi:hypothetical protein
LLFKFNLDLFKNAGDARRFLQKSMENNKSITSRDVTIGDITTEMWKKAFLFRSIENILGDSYKILTANKIKQLKGDAPRVNAFARLIHEWNKAREFTFLRVASEKTFNTEFNKGYLNLLGFLTDLEWEPKIKGQTALEKKSHSEHVGRRLGEIDKRLEIGLSKDRQVVSETNEAKLTQAVTETVVFINEVYYLSWMRDVRNFYLSTDVKIKYKEGKQMKGNERLYSIDTEIVPRSEVTKSFKWSSKRQEVVKDPFYLNGALVTGKNVRAYWNAPSVINLYQDKIQIMSILSNWMQSQTGMRCPCQG